MKILYNWKDKLTKDWSSWALYLAMFLAGLQTILESHGRSVLEDKTYSVVIMIISIITLVLKILQQKHSVIPEEKKDDSP